MRNYSFLRVLAGPMLMVGLMVCLTPVANSQDLVITENQTQQEAEQMILDIFVGTGVQVFNVAYVGFPRASGSFVGNTGLGLEDGFLMTSGLAYLADGPNDMPSHGYANESNGDPDLDKFNGGLSYDACVMNFDFIPFAKYITFKFSFASEEYPEYAPPNNSSYNDKFGFFLSGPGIEGPYSNNSVNIATLPNSSTVISINNVNAVTNQEYFVSNWQPVVNNNIQYDGYTTLIDIVAAVEPMETYHLKLAISDGGDGIYDSGLFFKAFSFKSTDIIGTPEKKPDEWYGLRLIPGIGPSRFTVDLGQQPGKDIRYSVFATTGQCTRSGQLPWSQTFTLEMDQLPAGVYVLYVDVDGVKQSQKFILQ
jgi:hypothetical protein